jgi:hypothetical protein
MIALENILAFNWLHTHASLLTKYNNFASGKKRDGGKRRGCDVRQLRQPNRVMHVRLPILRKKRRVRMLPVRRGYWRLIL